jgi:hypothetical protein
MEGAGDCDRLCGESEGGVTMNEPAKNAYNILLAIVALALLAFVIVLLSARQTTYKVLGILLLILLLFWLGEEKGEQAIIGGMDWAVSTFGKWVKKGSGT